jgi:hypothetical protein
MQTPLHSAVPLPLSGNTTDTQNKMLQNLLFDAVNVAFDKAIEELDRQSVQTLLDGQNRLKNELTKTMIDTLHRLTVSDKFKDESVGSNRLYPGTYRPRTIEAQVTDLKKAFPTLKTCNEKLARRPLPDCAEAWFAVPRWQSLAPTYNEAVQLMIDAIAAKRRFSNRIIGKLGETYLRASERAQLAQKILCEQQQEADILIVAAQFGLLHRGASARRTRAVLAGNEYGLGAFALGAMLLTHPERLSAGETLMIDCSGDEYSVRGDYTFDRVPLFDFDISGVEFSIFYEDRARSLWGTPTGFLFRPE